MFKSLFYRTGCLILICFAGALPSLSAGSQDTVRTVDPVPQPDSTMIHLNDQAFNRVLDRAIECQQKADSSNRLSLEWRKEAAKMDDPAVRGRLQKKIIQAEDSVRIYNELAKGYFISLNASLPEEVREEPPHRFLVRDTLLNGITVYRYNLTAEFMDLLKEIRRPVQAEKTARQTGFRIIDAPPYDPDQPYEHDYTLPPGVFYRIQLAVFSKEIAPDHFGGLSPITTESIPGKGMTRYFVGTFTHMEEARTALVKVRAQGYPDAFIIGYYDGQKISFSKLKALEK